MKFDATIPRWVRDEVAEITRPDERAIVKRVLAASPELRGPILKGLEKRSQKQPGPGRKMAILVRSVQNGLRRRPEQELLSPKEKADLAKRLAWAAKEFAIAWRAVASVTSDSPIAIQIGGRAVTELLSTIEPYAGNWNSRRSGDDTVLSSERRLLIEAVGRADVIAEAIATDAESWGQSKPLLDKPKHKNAERLWFIRYVTESFVHHFGEPMREEVVALTKIWFGDNNLTANTLSEIAKVEDLPHRIPRWRGRAEASTRSPVKKRPPSIKP